MNIPEDIEQWSEDQFKAWCRQPEVMMEVIRNKEFRKQVGEMRLHTKLIERSIAEMKDYIESTIEYIVQEMTHSKSDRPRFAGFSYGKSPIEGTDREFMLSEIDWDIMKSVEEEKSMEELHRMGAISNYLIRDKKETHELAFFNGDEAYRWCKVPDNVWDSWEQLHLLLHEFDKYHAEKTLDYERNETLFKEWFVSSEVRYGNEKQLLEEIIEARRAYYARIIVLKKEEMGKEVGEAFVNRTQAFLHETEPTDLKDYLGDYISEVHITNN